MVYFKQFLGVFLLFFSTISLGMTYLPLQKLDWQSKVEFAWDGHKVLVTPNISTMTGMGIAYGGPKIATVIGLLCYEGIKYPYTQKPGKAMTVIKEIYQKLKATPCATTQDFEAILNRYDSSIYQLAQKMAAQHSPMPGMQALVDELHELGYIQRIATNMGEIEFAAISVKNPQLFRHFKEGLTVNATNPMRKPSLEYYLHFQDRFNPDRTKIIVFVDDKLENVLSAQKAGMIAIHFKNAQQLRKELKKLGIALK